MMKFKFLGAWAFAAMSCQPLSVRRASQLCEGDLLFCVSAECNAITDVTQGVGGMAIDHVAIVHRQGEAVYALEAIRKGVVLTPVDSFMARNYRVGEQPSVLLGRLRDTTHVAASVRKALSYVGKPYDFCYLPDDSAIYCSELVQKSFCRVNGQPVFKPIPMSFHDRNGRITDYWKAFYAARGRQVPEGAPGSNPGDLSRRPELVVTVLKWQ